MLYIDEIDDYTVKFHDGGDNSQIYGKDLVARADAVDRIWISEKYKRGNVLNSALVSEITLEGNVYSVAEQFVSDFNLLMNNQALIGPVEVTTTTTTTV
jgi:hypothetical protein